jgi:hypothetical protein
MSDLETTKRYIRTADATIDVIMDQLVPAIPKTPPETGVEALNAAFKLMGIWSAVSARITHDIMRALLAHAALAEDETKDAGWDGK